MAYSNKNNFLAKNLVIPNYELILGEIQSFYLANMPNDDSQFSHVSPASLVAASPNLKQWLDSNKLVLNKSAIIKTPPPTKHLDPHTDTQYRDLALNFPVKNCEGCYTALYKMTNGTQNLKVLPNGLTYVTYSADVAFEEITGFILDGPVLFNTKVPHQVWNPTDKLRISASLRFTVDPWFLAE
jgi:hypothetical protein